MNKLRIDFNLLKSTTIKIFWQSVFAWLIKSNFLDSKAKETFINDYKELSSFKIFSNGKSGSLVSIDVKNAVQRKTFSVEIIDQQENVVKNINIFASFCGCPKFYYEELIASKYGDYSDEWLSIPKILKYVGPLIKPSKMLISVLPVLDENGNFKRKIERIEQRYCGLAKVNPISASETESLNIQRNLIHPGKTLLLLTGEHCSAFEFENIDRLDWYILSRTNWRWRNKQNKFLNPQIKKITAFFE